jgi:hypothetical protein
VAAHLSFITDMTPADDAEFAFRRKGLPCRFEPVLILPACTGLKKAELVLTGRTSAGGSSRDGIRYRAVPADKPEEEVERMAKAMCCWEGMQSRWGRRIHTWLSIDRAMIRSRDRHACSLPTSAGRTMSTTLSEKEEKENKGSHELHDRWRDWNSKPS